MVSSSAGMGAMYRAQLDAAMPMAQQDADTMAKFKQTEQLAVNEKRRIDQEAQVSGDLTLQKAKLNEEQKKIDDSFALKMKGVDADTEKVLTDIKGNWDQRIGKSQADYQKILNDSNLGAQTTQILMNQSQDAVNQVQISISNLMGNTEFLSDMGAADDAGNLTPGTTLRNYMNKLIGTATGGIVLSTQAAGLYTPEFAGNLEDMIEGLSW